VCSSTALPSVSQPTDIYYLAIRKFCLATANARRCWEADKTALLMNLGMECG